MSRPVLILKAGSTFEELARLEGDFEDWVRAGLDLPDRAVEVIDTRSGGPLPVVTDVVAAVITGSHDMVTENPPGTEKVSAWLRDSVSEGVPVLGICYGHQLLAQALGGEVGWHPAGRRVGTVEVRVLPAGKEDPLFRAFPGTFPAPVSHAQLVRKLPPGAARLAAADHDPHHGFRVGRSAWGIQFHPEFSESVMRHYIEWHRDRLVKQGLDPDRLLETLAPSPSGQLLRRFGEWARKVRREGGGR